MKNEDGCNLERSWNIGVHLDDCKKLQKLEKLPILKRATQRVECIHAPPRRGRYWQSQKKMGTYEPSSGIFFPGKIQKNTQNSEIFSKGLKL